MFFGRVLVVGPLQTPIEDRKASVDQGRSKIVCEQLPHFEGFR